MNRYKLYARKQRQVVFSHFLAFILGAAHNRVTTVCVFGSLLFPSVFTSSVVF